MKIKDRSNKTMKELRLPDEATQIEQNKKIFNEHFDVPLLKKINEYIDILDDTYFRSEYVGFEEDYPERNNPDKPIIFVSNHSGMAFPWDGMVFCSRLFKLKNYGKDALRPLVAPMLSQTILMNPFLMKNIWKKVGSIDAYTLNFETMMCQNEYNLMIYPEGVPGIAKGFNNRYQLQRFSTSFVRMSIKHQTDVVPIYTINGEYINPHSYQSNFVNNLSKKIGIPFIPIAFHTLLILIQPWFFYYALPAKLTYVKGKRMSPYQMVDKPFDELTMADLEKIRDKVHQQMQNEIDSASKKYGEKPYRWSEFFKKAFQNIKLFPYYFPFAWPLLFAEFERQVIKKKDTKSSLKLGFLSSLRIIFQNPMVIAYYIPLLGWIPLLIKGYGKK